MISVEEIAPEMEQPEAVEEAQSGLEGNRELGEAPGATERVPPEPRQSIERIPAPEPVIEDIEEPPKKSAGDQRQLRKRSQLRNRKDALARFRS